MPAPLDVNKEAVRVLATAVGVREAARRMNLKEVTVMQWSVREKWFADPVKPPTMKGSSKAVSGVSKSPAEALSEHMQHLSGKSKLGLAVTADRMIDHFQELPVEQLVGITPAIKDAAAIADKAHQWSKSQEQNSLVSISFVQPTGEAAPIIDIQADRL